MNGRGDTPNRHDILTGANADGTTAAGQTCGDWTLSGEGTAMVGHHDRMGLRDDAPSRSWNASHGSRGCSQEALQGTGGPTVSSTASPPTEPSAAQAALAAACQEAVTSSVRLN
ncbi:MAG: hypothetical protein R3D25_17940 [Geminicoccaceae bacterium]